MNIPFLCVFVAFLLNFITKIPVAIAMGKSVGGYDNRNPRDQQAKLSGWGKRALGAHQNGFESFPAFAAAVIIGHLCGINENTLTIFSVSFIITRLIYVALYLADKSTLRSIVWGLGVFCIAAIFWLAIF